MIYSKVSHGYIPITINKTELTYNNGGRPVYMYRYMISDGKIPVGFVDLENTQRGVHVNFIHNMNPQLYSGLGRTADQIEVEHCLQRGLKDFQIESTAAMNSHALHYLRGKRFIPKKFNQKVKQIIEATPKGEKYNTSFLGMVKMYMPRELIQKYIEIIKQCPLLR